MQAWILLSIAAAAFQTLRFVLQKHLSMGTLSVGGATFARFAYSMPFVLVLAALYLWHRGGGMPALGPMFWPYALSGGLAQILATWCMVALFAARNFAVGITFKKTETVQTALIGLIVLGDRVSAAGMAAIVLGLVGVVILSGGAGADRWRIFNRAAALGLIAGALFAVSAVGYRGATLQVSSDDALMRALVTLAAVTTSQALAMAAWLRWREGGEIGRVIAARRTAVWMGLTGLGGSLCWFTAFTLQNAAYVFAVGQVEVIFSLIAARLFFGERITRREGAGVALVTASVIAVGLFR
ncbi:EamA-like transporter family protein [Roseovarius nanhaiticus]|uniref:EamA-like transporter family protein n=1 Tax=Roseovarius nanhaiticus TaxID=573024 RepID=A0A1N7FFI5_9RHOB|nr:DMT family transporter [Roseovarius nanhaiticus]SEK55557.1 EamA-like transporter family protein [Roseovarius nanhaiticus]SIR99188.1 EamA-like transporter family protein [Roseovarius nanhaiticus]